jgi:regulatory protein
VRITGIEKQKKRADRRNIYADGAFLAGVSTETLARLALRVGDEIGPDQLKILQQMEEQHGARRVALRFLATRPRTEKEIRSKLESKEFGEEEIRKTLADLAAAHLVDDLEFTRAFLRDARALRPAGAIQIKRKLLLLGVARETIEQVVREDLPPETEAEAARALAEKFLRRSRGSERPEPPEKRRARLAAFLGRKGYSWDIIQRILKDLTRTDE